MAHHKLEFKFENMPVGCFQELEFPACDGSYLEIQRGRDSSSKPAEPRPEPMMRSAATYLLKSRAVGALLVMVHPLR